MTVGKSIKTDMMVETLASMLVPRDDSSIVEVKCAPEDYSASRLAHAVEDADVHLVDLVSTPSEGGLLKVTMRVRAQDPASVVLSLERYGYQVTGAQGRRGASPLVAAERLRALQTLLNV